MTFLNQFRIRYMLSIERKLCKRNERARDQELTRKGIVSRLWSQMQMMVLISTYMV
jgi:hypothetical protein